MKNIVKQVFKRVTIYCMVLALVLSTDVAYMIDTGIETVLGYSSIKDNSLTVQVGKPSGSGTGTGSLGQGQFDYRISLYREEEVMLGGEKVNSSFGNYRNMVYKLGTGFPIRESLKGTFVIQPYSSYYNGYLANGHANKGKYHKYIWKANTEHGGWYTDGGLFVAGEDLHYASTPSKYSVTSTPTYVHYDAIKDLSKDELKLVWKDIAASKKGSIQSFVDWIAIGETGRAEDTGLNTQLFKYYNPKLLNIEHVTDDTKAKADGAIISEEDKQEIWYKYLDALMCCYTLSGNSAEWSNAINNYISGNNLDTSPISIEIETCPIITLNGVRGNIPALEYMMAFAELNNDFAPSGINWWNSARAANYSKEFRIGGQVDASDNIETAVNLGEAGTITLLNGASQAMHHAYEFLKVKGGDPRKGWSGGVPSYTVSKDVLKGIYTNPDTTPSNTKPGYLNIKPSTQNQVANKIAIITEMDELNSGAESTIYGFSIHSAPCVVASTEFGNLIALPDNKPVEGKEVDENVSLEVYSGIDVSDYPYWFKLIDEAKNTKTNFTITVDFTSTTTDLTNYTTSVVANPTIVNYTPDQMLEWVKGKKAINAYDKTLNKLFKESSSECVITYTADITIVNGETELKSTVTDTASFIPRMERIGYTSKPEAYTEFKNYGVGSNMSGTLVENFEAMAGVPSTEQMYFAAGGSEFIVDVTLNEVNDEVAYRTYDNYYTGTPCEFKEGDKSLENWTVPSGPGSGDYSLNVHNGDLTVSCTIQGSIGNDAVAPAPTLHSSTCPAIPNAGDLAERASLYNQLTAWYNSVGAFVISHTAASDGVTRTTSISAVGNGNLPSCPSNVPQDKTDEKSCSYEAPSGSIATGDYDPGKPCGNEMAQAQPDGAASWSVTATWTIPHHVICGPCCEHELPEVHDTWTQSVEYDSMEINDVHVWRIDQGAIEGLTEIVSVDKVGADVVKDIPTIFYNIALKNDTNFKNKSYSYNGNKYGKATGTSYTGRIKYLHESESFDCVVRNLGVRTNKCDGLAHTVDANTNYEGGDGHGESYATGFIYTNSSEGYTKSRRGNSKHGETASTLNPRTTVTGGANYVELNTDAKDKATKEYSELKPLRDYTTKATMVTDFLILQTSSGDQSVMYYQKESAGTVKVDEEIPDIEAGVLGKSLGAELGGSISGEMWTGNALSASNWTQDHIALGSYTGQYWLGSGKFKGNAGGQNVKTKWDTDWKSESSKAGKSITQSQGTKVMIRPAKVNQLMIYAGHLNLDLSNTNEAYYTGYSEVFWSNQLHWYNKNYKRQNNTGATINPYSGRKSATDGAIYSTTETKFNKTATDVNYPKNDGSGAATYTYQDKAKFQFNSSDYVTKGGFALEAIYAEGKEKCNDIIVHDPVSTYDTYLISLPEYRDQRTEDSISTSSMNDTLNANNECPGSPEECDYRILDCQYFKDALLFSSDFNTVYDSDGVACIKNSVTNNLLTLPNGFNIESNSVLNSKVLSSFGTRMRIPFSELELEYNPSTHLKVEADIQISPSGTNKMIFSFNNFDLWLPATDEYGKTDNPYVYFNSGHGREKKVNEPLADGKKHHIVVEFAFAGVPYCTMSIDGKACTYTNILNPYSIDANKIGNTFNIGSWNANDNYGAGFYLDNLKIFRLGGSSVHTDECYVIDTVHDNNGANNAHKHTEECLADKVDTKSEPGMIVKVQDGYTWGRVFYHNTASGLFSNSSEVLSVNTSNKFSVLGKIQDLKYSGDSKYIFMLYYPETGQKNIWKQSKRPQDDTIADGSGTVKATGYEAINISMSGNYWGGLTKSTVGQTLIDGSVNHNNWWYAIGAYSYHGGTGYIPGGNNTNVKQVELWMAVDEDYTTEGDSATFNYTGNYQTYTVPSNGYYKLEAWGASGGGTQNNSVGSHAGQGGYTAGTTYLTKGTKLYVYVGEAGKYVEGSVMNDSDGSWNGGGFRTNSSTAGSSAGGGASDIRLINGAWNNSDGLKSRILVAGGGGGTDDATGGSVGSANDGSGGAGGGLTAESGRVAGAYNSSAAGGSQTSGANFGKGGDCGCATDTGSGGGGYYGGKASHNNNGGAGGGSSYVSRYPGCDTTYLSYQGNYTFTDVTLQQGGNYGNGKVVITRLSTMTDMILDGLKTGSMSEAELRKYLGDAYDYINKTYSETLLKSYSDWSTSMNGFYSIGATDGKALSNGNLQITCSNNSYEVGLETDIEGSAISKIEFIYAKGKGPDTNAAGIGIIGTSGTVQYKAAKMSTNSDGEVVATITPGYTGKITKLYFDFANAQPTNDVVIKRISIYGYGSSSAKSSDITVYHGNTAGTFNFKTSVLGSEMYKFTTLRTEVTDTTNSKQIVASSGTTKTTTKTLGKNTNYSLKVNSSSGSKSFGTGTSTFTAEDTSTYSVRLYGAGGGADASASGSAGSVVIGTININKGDAIKFVVGGAGSTGSGSGGGYPDGYNAGSSGSSGGGGGSTSLYVNNTLKARARGGNGGSLEGVTGYGGDYDGGGYGGGSNNYSSDFTPSTIGTGTTGNGSATITWNIPGDVVVQVTRTVLVIRDTNFDEESIDILMKYYTLIPDTVDGKINPLWSNCKNEYNYHLCTDKCKLVKTLVCSEPHHDGLHYEHSNKTCWKACDDDSKHKIVTSGTKINTGNKDNSFTPGNFINLDYGFTIYFPNRGKFEDGQPYGIGNITTQKGLGFKDTYTKELPYGTTTSGLNGGIPSTSSGLLGQNVGMNTSKWTRIKRIKFNFDVIYKDKLYVAGEWIYLGDRGVYNGPLGDIGNENKYDDTKWSNYGTDLYNDIYKEYYDFYCVLENNEAKNASYTVEVTSLNCNDFKRSGDYNVNDNLHDMLNKQRSKNYSAFHGGTNYYYFDIVGRIGNLVLEDVEDFRFSNLFKTAVSDGNKSLENVTKEYTVSSGLSTKDYYNTDNENAYKQSKYITTNAPGAYVCVKELEPEKAYYEIIIEGNGLGAGRLEVTDNYNKTALDDELFTVITKSSTKQSWYMDLSELEDIIPSMDIKYISKSNATMMIQKITVIKLGETPDSWLLDGIVSEVDESKPRDYMSWVADIRGIRISSKTKWIDTYGSAKWAQDIGDKHNLNFPLSPEKNNISILQDEPMLTGYSALMDISTIGNYDSNKSKLTIIPRYYALDIQKEELLPLDVYMKHGSAYVPINYFDNVNKNSDKILDKEVYENIINFDWLYEKTRRNVTEVEESKTDKVYTETLNFANAANEAGKESGDLYTYSALNVPGGHVCTIGTNQYLQLDGHARTFIGGTSTYGELKNIGNRIADVKWYKQAQRWHFSIGVPSSAVFVKQGKEINKDTIVELSDGSYVVICALEITADGDLYSLKYKHEFSGSEANTEKGTDSGYTSGPEGGIIEVTDNNGKIHTLNLYDKNYNKEIKYDPVVFIYNPAMSSTQDVEIIGTH